MPHLAPELHWKKLFNTVAAWNKYDIASAANRPPYEAVGEAVLFSIAWPLYQGPCHIWDSTAAHRGLHRANSKLAPTANIAARH